MENKVSIQTIQHYIQNFRGRGGGTVQNLGVRRIFRFLIIYFLNKDHQNLPGGGAVVFLHSSKSIGLTLLKFSDFS